METVRAATTIKLQGREAERESVYAAVCYAWKLDPNKARAADIVLAVERGLIIGVFKADRWIEATPENFPETPIVTEGAYAYSKREMKVA